MEGKINILMIDDDEEDFIIVRDLFNEIDPEKYAVDWVSTYKEGVNIISEKQHDAYLIDYRLNADDGLELISEVLKIGCDKPLILLTGLNDINIDKQAMKAGASDYLVKGSISPSILERSIRYAIDHAKNINEIKNLNANLEKRIEERTQELEEKIALIQEIHHRVKNNLQVIVSLIHLQSNQIKDELLEGVFKSFESKIETMAMVYKMTYSQGSLLNINLSEFINTYIDFVLNKYKKNEVNVSLNINLFQNTVNIDTAISLGLLLNEILTNAIKFSYSNTCPSQISIQLKDDGQHNFDLKIGDNGKGIPKEVLANDQESLGLFLIHDLIDQLDGTYTRNSNEQGTHYDIGFKEIHR